MKTIVIYADPIDNQKAGVHYYTLHMIHALLQNDTSNQYIILRSKKDDQFNTYPNVRIIAIPRIPGITILRLAILFPLISMYYKADIVIEPAHFGPFMLSAKIKRVTVIHDISAVLFPQWHTFFGSTLQRLFLDRILHKASLIISNSHFTQAEIEKKYPYTRHKIKTIYPGIPHINLEKPDENTMNVDLQPFFLYVGTIEPRKNLELLIAAFEAYKKQNISNMQLYIVGARGWRMASFFTALDNNAYKNEIHILGYVNEQQLRYYYKNCYAFIYPSIYEGFGFPVLEAMQQGAYCITTRDSSMYEISYPFASYFENNTMQSLLDAMNNIPNFANVNDKEEIIQHTQKYTWHNFAEQLITTLNNL